VSIRRERKDSVEHHQLILQTAQALFNEHGVRPVSMHQIAKTAGIGQATLYRRYAHKGDLCLDILQDYGHRMMNQLISYLQEHKHASPLERLGGILDQWIDAIEEKSDLLIAMEVKMNCEDFRGNFFHSPMYRFLRENISKLLVEIVDADPKLPIDPDLTAHAIICSLSPVGYFHIKQEKGYSKDQMKNGYLQMCRMAAAN
jgi:AcrR family transcriptional regulator